MERDDDTPPPSPCCWIDAAGARRADVSAGRTVGMADFLARMDTENEAMVLRLAKRDPDAA